MAFDNEIRACCPCCDGSPKDVEILNSGPITRIHCKNCGIVYNENDALKEGYKDIVAWWNHKGIYIVHDEN